MMSRRLKLAFFIYILAICVLGGARIAMAADKPNPDCDALSKVFAYEGGQSLQDEDLMRGQFSTIEVARWSGFNLASLARQSLVLQLMHDRSCPEPASLILNNLTDVKKKALGLTDFKDSKPNLVKPDSQPADGQKPDIQKSDNQKSATPSAQMTQRVTPVIVAPFEPAPLTAGSREFELPPLRIDLGSFTPDTQPAAEAAQAPDKGESSKEAGSKGGGSPHPAAAASTTPAPKEDQPATPTDGIHGADNAPTDNPSFQNSDGRTHLVTSPASPEAGPAPIDAPKIINTGKIDKPRDSSSQAPQPASEAKPLAPSLPEPGFGKSCPIEGHCDLQLPGAQRPTNG